MILVCHKRHSTKINFYQLCQIILRLFLKIWCWLNSLYNTTFIGPIKKIHRKINYREKLNFKDPILYTWYHFRSTQNFQDITNLLLFILMNFCAPGLSVVVAKWLRRWALGPLMRNSILNGSWVVFFLFFLENTYYLIVFFCKNIVINKNYDIHLYYI